MGKGVDGRMGKYSLESFERYPTIRCRPLEKAEPAEGAGISRFATVRVTLGGERPVLRGRSLLEVSVPARDIETMPKTESALRSLASAYHRDPLLLGVTLVTDAVAAKRRRLWETAAEAFAPTRYYVPVTDGEQLDYALKHGLAGGLIARVDGNPYDICEAFAEQGAQQLFKQMPVLVSFQRPGEGFAKYTRQWHAAAVEGIDAPAGWRIALRRLTYPKALSSGGFAPMRFWWVNRGPSYCHENVEVRLRLERDGEYTPILLHDRTSCFHLADRAYNEIVRLPEVVPGRYQLQFGVFAADGTALTLANDGRTDDGYYPADVMNIDDMPRPELETVWDGFYPDGYYPLEDPKEPM